MMTTTIMGGVKLALCGASGLIAGIIIGQTPAISNSSTVSVEIVASLVIAGITSAFWLSRSMTKLFDGQTKLSEGQTRLQTGLDRIQDKFDNLPCHQWRGVCKEKGEK